VPEDAGRRIIETPHNFRIFLFHDQLRRWARTFEKGVRAVSPNHRKTGGVFSARLIQQKKLGKDATDFFEFLFTAAFVAN
jgi:hypothetical protein